MGQYLSGRAAGSRAAVRRQWSREARLRRVRLWLVFFMVALVLSGLTAFPLESELRVLAGY
ncbi:MAG TPA: hypothetical protein VL547_23565, partial [Dinghuibacter sp.]|nr:hypothetical protein [Dinghuibacter sp.]